MKLPRITLAMTIAERDPDVLRRVLQAAERQHADQMVIAFDGTPPALQKQCHDWAFYHAVNIVRKPGWICSARAWNMAFGAVDTELTFVISSDVVLNPGAVQLAREALATDPHVLYGKCEESDREKAAVDPNTYVTLCSSEKPRPLGFIMALPTWALRKTGGYDEGLMDGFWFEDDDFTMRLWQTGLPFVFSDHISGYHQTHERTFLTDAKIQVNRDYMLKKWGHEHPLHEQTIHQYEHGPGLTLWTHTPLSYNRGDGKMAAGVTQ